MKNRMRALLVRSVVEMGVFSTVINLLLLVPPLYLLQIYDRVLPSSSMNTLIYITLFATGAIIILGVLDLARSLYAARLASRLAADLGPSAFVVSMVGPRAGLGDVQPLRDLASIRNFLASRSLSFLFDLPFGPLFVALLYLIHPLLFWVTVSGAAIMIAIAVLNQVATSRSDRAAADALASATTSAQSFARSFESVRALGMVQNTLNLWGNRYSDALLAGDRVGAINAAFSAISRTVRTGLQMLILGVGAYLVLNYEITAGMIFASAIISGRALQPLDQIIGGWQQVVEAQRAWKRVMAAADLDAVPAGGDVALPDPQGRISVENLVYYPPQSDMNGEPLIKRLSFTAEAGEAVAIIGPSRAGKSTLARLIVGAIGQHSGIVRIDGADLRNWDPDRLGRFLGYMPQEVELFPGTIAQNIARFSPDASAEAVMQAARLAHVHEMILGERNAYDTAIGPGGVRLSGGERQRIGLARAFFGDPRLLVLDEPNANLDSEGEAALERTLQLAKTKGITVLIITHKPSIASRCDRVLLLNEGRMEMYGPAADVLQRLHQNVQPPSPSPPPQPQHQEADATRPRANANFVPVVRVGGIS